ncbi:MAG: hypothetical protein AAF591_17045 [Verrucomicrobiota bacterium]
MGTLHFKHAPSLTLWSCILWIVFYVASFAALGQAFPTVGSSGSEIVAWFTDNGTRALFYAWTAAFAALSLTVFGAMLTGLFPSPHRYIIFGGVLMWVITGMVQAWFWAALAYRAQSLEPGIAEIMFVIPQFWGPIINGSTMTMALPFILLGFGDAAIVPRWLAWLSVVLFIEQGVETITVFGQRGFLAPGGGMNLYLGGLIGLAWVIGAMVWGYRGWQARI